MRIDVGCFYFIRDSFFDYIDDPELMQNKENGTKRPCYYCFKSKDYNNIIWFIPISSKVEKYKNIYNKKLQKQLKLGKTPAVDTLVFGNVANNPSAFLIQNMFPVTEEYIQSMYLKNKIAVRISKELEIEILSKAMKVLNLYNHGFKNIIFPNIDKILLKLLKDNV